MSTRELCEYCLESGLPDTECGIAVATWYIGEDSPDLWAHAGRRSARVCHDCIRDGISLEDGARIVYDHTQAEARVLLEEYFGPDGVHGECDYRVVTTEDGTDAVEIWRLNAETRQYYWAYLDTVDRLCDTIRQDKQREAQR